MTPTADRLLIVDSEEMLCELMQFRLEKAGFEVDVTHTADDALKRDLASYSVLLIDLMDRDFTGLQLTRNIKRNPATHGIPIIMVTARTSEDDIVACFDAGADDFISKPFSSRILEARIRSMIRRRRLSSGQRTGNILIHEGLRLDIGAGTVSIDGEAIPLTRTEFLILALFMRHKNQFFDRAAIQNQAWEGENNVSDRAVDTNISRLRKKIGDYGRLIVNRQGFGYGFIG